MRKLIKYYEALGFFFTDFKKPFERLSKSLKSRWIRGLAMSNLKYSLIDDMDQIKNHFFLRNGKSPVIQPNKINIDIDKRILKELKISEFLKKVEGVDRDDKNYQMIISEMFDKYYNKLDKRISRIIDKIELTKSKEKALMYEVDLDEESILSTTEYRSQKISLQVELLKLQEWVISNNKKVAIVFEGRDAAGKGSSIKRFIEYLNPKFYRVVALGIPTKEESNNWFARYEKHLPNEGEMVFFDRSWYNRGVIEPTMNYCTEEQYTEFINNVNGWESELIDNGVILIKFWFSIGKEKQIERFETRKSSPLKHWKYSPNDEKTISKWNVMTNYKEQMFAKTSTPKSPWVVINSNDKRVSRLNSIRYLLSKIDYNNKDLEKDITPSLDIIKVID